MNPTSKATSHHRLPRHQKPTKKEANSIHTSSLDTINHKYNIHRSSPHCSNRISYLEYL